MLGSETGFVLLTLFLLSRVLRSNRELRRLNEQLQQVSGYKSDFLARMSHDLRTPMNAIIGYTRILLRRTVDDLDPRMFRNLENIHTSADHLLVLINDILDLSRIEAGRIDLTPRDTDVKSLVEGCVAAVEPLVRSKVELRQELDDLPAAHLDPDRLRRVVINLLSNAAKFTDTGTITVSLRATKGDAGSTLELTVADTGIGIPPEDLPHVFEEFRRVNGAGNAQEGSGLGLSIARRSVELIGGTITAESVVGQGSTFTVRLPGPSSGGAVA
ncbi:MAG: HAMP domain-containing sensor histidine kinase [bacterium]|nr:HAMP domain-containing sensor histidine kinase [bacterium]